MRIQLLSVLTLTAFATGQWQAASPPTSPPARLMPGMTYDPLTGRTILFGGQKVGIGAWNDTWSYDGTTWTQLSPVGTPSARGGIRLVYDTLRNVIVMYGGLNPSPAGGPSINQTWEFNGTAWTQIGTANSPGGRGQYGLAFDSTRGRTVLYGGQPNSFFPIDVDGTWEYDGVNWTQVVTPTNPGPLENMAMCYSPSLGRVVMFGGINVQVGGTTTLWGYDGVNWATFAVAGPTPSVRTFPMMCYDDDRGVCVLQGGMDPTNGTQLNDTWEWNGATWTQRVGNAPGLRRGFGFAFDQQRHAAVLFGGVTQNFTGLVDTWQYGAVVDAHFGVGCPGTNGVPVLSTATGAHVGSIFQTTMTNLLVAAPIAVRVIGFGALPAPADLSAFGMPGCTGYIHLDDIAIVGASGGISVHNVPVPNVPIYAGGEFYYTGLSFDTVNAFGGVVSNTLHAVIGY